MSQILFQGNNLVVTGEIGGEYSNQPIGPGIETPADSIRRTLYLNFIVQMNGKMVVHKEAMCLVVDNTSTENPSLEEWSTWYAICNIFDSFGYSFAEDKGSIMYNSGGIIREWIEKIISREKCTVPVTSN